MNDILHYHSIIAAEKEEHRWVCAIALVLAQVVCCIVNWFEKENGHCLVAKKTKKQIAIKCNTKSILISWCQNNCKNSWMKWLVNLFEFGHVEIFTSSAYKILWYYHVVEFSFLFADFKTILFDFYHKETETIDQPTTERSNVCIFERL